MDKLLFSILFLLTIFSVSAQPDKATQSNLPSGFETIKTYEDTLGLLSFLIVNDSLEENRLLAVKKFIPTLVKALKQENSFQYPFERLKSISIQYPADSTFRIFTWQLYVDENDYRYFGAIQMNTSSLKLFPLQDRSYEVADVYNEILPPEKWYGAVYYNLKEFDTSEGKKYLLFGYDGFSFDTKRKLIDVLSFEDGKPVFGSPVFVSTDPEHPHEPKNRIVLTFSAAASVKLNYDGHLDMIIFDHLIRGSSEVPGQGPTNLPDGSYEGYQLKNGQWEYVNKVFDHVYETAPREEPILNHSKKKDIFGKEN
jgi:hypothetical protein